jgi:hypothetical protein
MSIEPVTAESFEEWKHHPVTKRFMKMLQTDREAMKEGLINNAFEEEAEVKGRCRVIATLLNLEYEDLFETK